MVKKKLYLKRDNQVIRRGAIRWECARQGKKYKDAYKKRVLNAGDALALPTYVVQQYFLKEFKIPPLNPKFSLLKLCERLSKLEQESDNYKKSVNSIYERYFGRNWQEMRMLCIASYWSQNFEKIKNKLGSNWATEIKKIQCNDKKATEEIRKINYDKRNEKECDYLRHALSHLCAPVLASNSLASNTAVSRSYLTENNDVCAIRYGKHLELRDRSHGALHEYSGDLSKVTMELDLSCPKKELRANIEKEISLWNQVGKKFGLKRGHQHLVDIKKLLRVFELRSSGTSAKAIVKEIFPRHGEDSIKNDVQKIYEMFKKAEKYINGGYTDIR